MKLCLKKKIYLLLIFLNFSIVLKAQEYQIVDKNDFKINGKFCLFEKKYNLTNIIKQFDEIEQIEMEMECGFEKELNKGVKFYTYKKNGLEYFVYDKNADFQFIYFQHKDIENCTNNFVLYKKNRLSIQTTINELKELFPIAYKNYLKEISESNKEVGMLTLKFNKDWDDELRIFIQKGKIYAFSYWYPC